MSTEKQDETPKEQGTAEQIRQAEEARPREATAFPNPPQPSVNPPPKAPDTDDDRT